MRMSATPHGHVQRIVHPDSISTTAQKVGLMMEMGIVRQIVPARVCNLTSLMRCRFLRRRSSHPCVDSHGLVVALASRITMLLVRKVGPALVMNVWAHAHTQAIAILVSQQQE